jgi:hypothetical protein
MLPGCCAVEWTRVTQSPNAIITSVAVPSACLRIIRREVGLVVERAVEIARQLKRVEYFNHVDARRLAKA